jgi:hypothetical protein
MRNLFTLLLALLVMPSALAQSTALIQQGVTSGSDGNGAVIHQAGANSGVNALGFTAGAFIVQSGAGGNEAFITQTGDANYGRIAQNGSGNLARNTDVASLLPGIRSVGDDNAVDIVQDGTGNTATMLTAGNRNHTDVLQTGTANQAVLSVSGDAGTAAIDQAGEGNFINVRGHDSGTNATTALPGSNDYVLGQDGIGNRIFGMVGGVDNSITVQQNGTNNNLGLTASPRSGFMTVDGNVNVVNVLQSGSDHSAGVSILGSGNTARITQN